MSETTYHNKGDSLAEGYVSELWDFTRVSVTQNSLQELKEIWDQWNDENPAYSCFTFGKVDLVPTVEEYMALLRCSKIQVDRVYSRAINAPTFLKKRLMNITGMSDQWVTARIQQKGDSKVDVFALNIYRLVIFLKALGHIDEAVTDLFDRLDKRVTPDPAILVETFRSLNACRRAGEGRFVGCAQLLLAWFHSHFWRVDKVSYRVFSENYSPLKEIVATPMRDDISEEKWMAILQNLREEDVEWRAPWLLPYEILYRCGDFDWVPLLEIWGAIGYALLLVLRQYRSRQFIPTTHGLAECEFSYGGDGYKKKIREMSNAWNQTRRMKRLVVGPMTTPTYNEWWVRRINDNIPEPSHKNSQSIEEHLQVIPSELEIIKHDFEKRNAELVRKIEQMEEEKINLRLDADVQKLEAERLRKGRVKAEENLDSLKEDYKKLRLLMRTAGVQTQNEALKKSLLEKQKEKGELENRVTELEESLHRHRNQNSMMELKASLSMIEEMKERVEELETVLQNCEIRIEYLEVNEDRQIKQPHYLQNQVRNIDHVTGEAVAQIREVADHLQTLAVQADTLNVKYELGSSRGQELASLLRKIRFLSIRAKPYI
ncbi:hypothetical protein Godav_029590 [Gossypium davidsonii]|uniref:DUF7745 domain-containing protein n=1 Tax=Gossypium davidsonii TaxID=34287 RepID=A0A7J8T7K5_GOSDV|nr:hypothetical protein [Gossypium davidsonii]